MTHYTSLEHLRADKMRARESVGKTAKRVKAEIAGAFTPQANFLTNSSNRALKVVGCTIAAYKAARSARTLFGFVSKLL